ncbi:MAG: hypothetical protein V4546_12065 [Bacteroidota bacterium]
MRHEIKIYPDFKKLKAYYPNVDEQDIIEVKKDGIKIRLNYRDEENPFLERVKFQLDLSYITKTQFNRLLDELPNMVSERIGDFTHLNELIYLILKGNEVLGSNYYQHKDFYDSDMRAKEIATFLLAYKTASENNPFQIVAKENIGTKKSPITKSAAIKDREISNWICETIYQKILSGQHPFGDSLFSHYGLDPFGDNKDISISALQKASEITSRLPKVILRKEKRRFCEFIFPFIKENTQLVNPTGVKLSNKQAVFFYDLLCLLGHIPLDRKGISNIQYIHTLFNGK